MTLRHWILTPDCPPDFVRLFDRVRELDLAVLDTGDWVDLESQSLVRENHLRCMLRREYLKLWPGRGNKNANHAVQIFITEVVCGLRAYLDAGATSGKRLTLDIDDDYLPN